MSFTSSDVVTGALKILQVIAEGETPSAAQFDDGVAVLNDMMFAFPKRAVDIQHTALTVAAVIPLDDSYQRGLKYLLASDWAPQFGKGLGADAAQKADESLREFQADFRVVVEATIDTGLLIMPSQRGWYGRGLLN
jgi:hypothetical protein